MKGLSVPSGTNVEANMREAGKASFHMKGSKWFYDKVRNSGDWDYKQLDTKHESFGNFNFGATGAAFGFSEETLLRMAGWAQTQSGTSQPSWGVKNGNAKTGSDTEVSPRIFIAYQLVKE